MITFIGAQTEEKDWTEFYVEFCKQNHLNKNDARVLTQFIQDFNE